MEKTIEDYSESIDKILKYFNLKECIIKELNLILGSNIKLR